MDKIKKGLIGNSYARINDVITTNRDHKYHVDCKNAEVRQLFMHLRGKAALIEIAETSDDFWGEPRITYRIEFHFGYLPLSKLNKMCFNAEIFKKRNFLEFEEDTWHEKIIPGYNKDFDIPLPFKQYGASSSNYGLANRDSYLEESFTIETGGKPCTYHDCIIAIVSIVDQVKPYLGKLFDRRSSMRNLFAPTYQFPNCEDTFNRQFQEEAYYFHQLFAQNPHRKQSVDKFMTFE